MWFLRPVWLNHTEPQGIFWSMLKTKRGEKDFLVLYLCPHILTSVCWTLLPVGEKRLNQWKHTVYNTKNNKAKEDAKIATAPFT
jgi:hypothetical protein